VDDRSLTKTARNQKPDVRIGDFERQAAARQLQQHFADGRLTWEELDERLAVAYAARVNAELAGLFSDLPKLPPPAGMARAQPRRRWRPPVDVRLVIAIGLALLAAFAFLRLDDHHGGSFFLIITFWWLFAARARRGRRPGHRHHHQHWHDNVRS
jgi:Domain of unknown function (DUF1707)